MTTGPWIWRCWVATISVVGADTCCSANWGSSPKLAPAVSISSPYTSTVEEVGDAAAADISGIVTGDLTGAGELAAADPSSNAAIARNNLRRSPSSTPSFSRS